MNNKQDNLIVRAYNNLAERYNQSLIARLINGSKITAGSLEEEKSNVIADYLKNVQTYWQNKMQPTMKKVGKGLATVGLATLLATTPAVLTGCDETGTSIDTTGGALIEDSKSNLGNSSETILPLDYAPVFQSEIGQAFAQTEEYKQLLNEYIEFKNSNPELTSNKGSKFNLTVEDFYKNHTNLNLTEWDIQNNTFVQSFAQGTDGKVYIFLQTNLANKPEILEQTGREHFYINRYTLLQIEDVDDSLVQDFLNGDNFVKFIALTKIVENGYTILGDGHTGSNTNIVSNRYLFLGEECYEPYTRIKGLSLVRHDDSVSWYALTSGYNEGDLDCIVITESGFDSHIDESYKNCEEVLGDKKNCGVVVEHVFKEVIELNNCIQLEASDYGTEYNKLETENTIELN